MAVRFTKLLACACVSVCAWSQTPPTTPNGFFYLPAHGSYGWDTYYNSNWGTSDTLLNQFHSVLEYGAKMDGVTDDSAALQKCLNTGYCFVPNGTLKFLTPQSFALTSLGAAHLTCASKGAVLKFAGTGDALAALGTGQTQPGFTVDNCTVNLSGAGAGSNGIHIRAFSGGLIRNVTVTNANSDGLLNEGANSLMVENFDASSSGGNGIHNKGINLSGVGYSANANQFIGGILMGNAKWGVFEDASAVSGPVTPNQNNVYSNVVFEPNGTSSTVSGMAYIQGCLKCSIHHSFFEQTNSAVPYNVVVGATSSDGIGNLNSNATSFDFQSNILFGDGQVSITLVQVSQYNVSNNVDEGTPTYFINFGSTGTTTGYAVNNRALSATSGMSTGLDSSGMNITDIAQGGFLNSYTPTIYGTGFVDIAGAIANQEIRLRSNGSSLIAAFQNSGGSTVASVNSSGQLTLQGFTGSPQDSPGFKYKTQTSCTTSAAQFSTCNTTVTWTTAFADTGYVTVCSPGGNVNGPVTVIDQPSRTTTSVTVTIANYGTNATASYTSLACAAWHP